MAPLIPKGRKNVRGKMFAYWGLKLIQKCLGFLPGAVASFLGRFFGGLFYCLDFRHRRIALQNLALAFFPEWSQPELRRLARKSFCQLGFNFVEFLRIPRSLRSGWEKRFRIDGQKNLREALKRGRGVIFVLAHFGNWEYLGFLPRLLSFRAAVVGQEIKNPAVDGLVKNIREELGLELFPKYEVVAAIMNFLKANGTIAILADQRARKMNVRTIFFGHPVDTTAAPAVLALKSQAALLPAFIYYEGRGRYHIVIESSITIPCGLRPREAVREITQRVTSVLEERIRQQPEFWLWGHRRWR